jgi:nucleotide-binding universal stress UspA family protein
METFNFQSILLTTDLSQDSVKAYSAALSLKERYGASLTLLSCIDTSMQYSGAGIGALEVPPIYQSRQDTQVVKDLQKQINEHTREYFAGTALTVQIRQGPLPVEHSIIAYANEEQFVLIIMASHGRSGIRRALLGSVAEYVLRHSKCPVLVVPTRAS